MQDDASRMQHPFQCFLLTFYVSSSRYLSETEKIPTDLRSTCSSFCFGSHPNSQYNQIRPKSQVLSTKPTSYKTHPIKAVVERTFAGKTTCNSIPRLGGLKFFLEEPSFFNTENSAILRCFFLWLSIPRWFCGVLWTWYWYLFENLLRYIMAVPNLLFWCEFFFGERRHHKDLEDWFKKPLDSLVQDQQWQCLYALIPNLVQWTSMMGI